MSRRTRHAPAKINLGLEILGRRADGYHEVCTVLCSVSLHDTLEFEPCAGDRDDVSFVPRTAAVDDDQNLVMRALRLMRDAGAEIPAQRIRIQKRIPEAAGLGGASSDAASTLLAFSGVLDRASVDIEGIARKLGSDVPFFLDGPIALATGRGDKLAPLPPPRAIHWVVLATPILRIQDKTRTMYGAVDQAWWTSGDDVQAIAARLPDLPAAAPANVFERALIALHPEMDQVRQALVDCGFPFVALSGAGPTFYTIIESGDEAQSIARRVNAINMKVHVARLAWLPPVESDLA